MSLALLLIPDFLLILFGFFLNRITDWGRGFWGGLEKLIYYVLFPALLFISIAKQKIDFVAAAPALKAAVATVLIGMALAYAVRWILKPEEKIFASGFQLAFRFNSYIGLAIAGRLHGEAGIAAFGIVIGIVVPLCNAGAVWALARHNEGRLWKELVQNPLILATVGGVLYSLSGLPLPEFVQNLISRMGAASLACGLLAVGAALKLQDAGRNASVLSYFTAVKLLAMPVAAIFLARALGVTGVYFEMVVLLATMPTATSAYVLAVRMGGDGNFVAQGVTVSTLAGMLATPLWLNYARAL
jgi:malonate transporter and related proteins